MYHSFGTASAMFQCNTLYCYTKCSLCSPVAKGYVPPCTYKYCHTAILLNVGKFKKINFQSMGSKSQLWNMVGSKYYTAMFFYNS